MNGPRDREEGSPREKGDRLKTPAKTAAPAGLRSSLYGSREAQTTSAGGRSPSAGKTRRLHLTPQKARPSWQRSPRKSPASTLLQSRRTMLAAAPVCS